MTTEVSTRIKGTDGGPKRAVLTSLALGAALASMVAVAGPARQAEAALADKIIFTSNRAAGPGVDNPTRDYEIFSMNPDGTGARQLTFNKGEDYEPTLSPDGTKIAYMNRSVQASDGQGGNEIFVMNALDGSGKKNLTNNGLAVDDYSPEFTPGGKRIAYSSFGKQTSNPEGDNEVYVVNVLDGSGKKNLTNNAIEDYSPGFSPAGGKIVYVSRGVQASNPEGDGEVYAMNASDGTDRKNLSNNGASVGDFAPDFSSDGQKIAYTSDGVQTSNLEGDLEVYVMNAADGTGQMNLTNNGNDVSDFYPAFSPGGNRIAYESGGIQTSNPQGDLEVYAMNATDGMGKKNLSNNGAVDGFYLGTGA